ncbi:MAG TPA: DUF4097 family beta strand repeat-containing protein [Bryobacteraceae bacterium]|nr:DUF4097 family beta strand repeat-containing protein [Bryobacteraceae bacterium]
MNRIQAVVLLGSLAGLCSCDDFEGFGRVQQDFHYSYTMQPGGHLDVDNRNGSISIIGWDRDSVDVAGTKYAPTDADLKEVHIKVDVTGRMASITTESPREAWGNYGANYTIHLPHNTVVTRAKSTNGSVTAEDMSAGGSLSSTNGRISLHRDDGNFDLHTTNGGIELEDCSGVERAETTNGSVRGILKAGAFEARSTNGAIDLTLLKPRHDEALRASTTNGTITVALREFAGNPIHVETTHGGVTLRLPHDTDARIEARTSLSHITSELPVSSEESDKHELRGQLGKGGPVISASTTTGSIRIEDGGR